jgi:hypothetical protein
MSMDLSLPWYAALSDWARRILSELGQEQRCDAGQTVIAKGAAESHLFLVVQLRDAPPPGFNGRKDEPADEDEGCRCGGGDPAAGVALALAAAFARRRRATGDARRR